MAEFTQGRRIKTFDIFISLLFQVFCEKNKKLQRQPLNSAYNIFCCKMGLVLGQQCLVMFCLFIQCHPPCLQFITTSLNASNSLKTI